MRAYQQQVNQKLKEDPNIAQFFTLARFSSRTAFIASIDLWFSQNPRAAATN